MAGLLMFTELVSRLLKRLLCRLNGKFARLLLILSNHKGAGSLGALAGFAISVTLTWKLLTSPAGKRRRRKSETDPASTSNSGSQTSAVNFSSEDCLVTQHVKELQSVIVSHPPLHQW